MPTFSKTGFTVIWGDGEDDGAVGLETNTQFRLFAPTGSSTNISYSLMDSLDGEDGPDAADIDGSDDLLLSLNGGAFPEETEELLLTITWDEGGTSKSAQVLVIEELQDNGFGGLDYANRMHVFHLSGDLPPAITTAAQWDAFDGAITAVEPIASGPFAPEQNIKLADLFDSRSQNDFVVTEEDTREVDTGRGNDTIIAMDNDDYVEIFTGKGRDRVDFSNVEEGFFDLNFSDLDAGIDLSINGKKNRGVIDKGDNGTTRLVDVEKALEGGGMALYGSNFDDRLSITPVADSWMSVRGLDGADEINIGRHSGFVRLDLRGGDGVVADLGARTVSDDGFGNVDTISGRGRINEIRSSMGDDDITGSRKDDRFILMAGDDTVDGGRGFDTLRYDRSGVEAVEVNLAQGTASGTWRGEDFTHDITSIEAVRGSREGDDTLTGNRGANELEGRGGNDTLKGLGGNDTLDGGEGNDFLVGGGGNDDFVFDFGRDKVKDFTAGEDQVDLNGWFSDVGSTLADLEASGVVRQSKGNVVIGSGDAVMVLLKTDLDDLSDSDFIF